MPQLISLSENLLKLSKSSVAESGGTEPHLKIPLQYSLKDTNDN
jgi:hypothetical protein